jgi:type IV pilus assembly protein PilW
MMKKLSQKQNNERGLSLVELMISMTLGLVVSGGAITLYIASAQNYALNSTKTLMQENANFAMHFFEEKLNSASVGNTFDCGSGATLANTIWNTNTNSSYDTDLIFSGGIRGYSVGAGESGIVGGIEVSGIKEESDFIVFGGLDLSNSDTNIGVNIFNANAANFRLDQNYNSREGQVLLVVEPDCSEMAIFMSTHDRTDAKILHNTGINANGFTNCSKSLKGDFTCTGPNNNDTTGGDIAAAYGDNAMLLDLSGSAYGYTIQPVTTDEGVINSLFIIDINAGTEQEMVRGVDDLELSYGMNTNSSNTGRAYVGRYMTADQVDADASVDWSDLLTVKVKLKMSSEMKVTHPDGRHDFIEKEFERVFAIKSRVL